MPLGPEDIVRKTFRTSIFRRGYDESEVDAFMDELVSDLRRREAEREELLAELHRPRTVDEVETDRVLREREQLDLIRTERQELVSEMGGLTSRLATAKREIDTAEQRVAEAEAEVAEADRRRTEATVQAEELERHVARAQAIHDDLRGAYDAMVSELRSLRTEAETRGIHVLGEEPTEPTGNPVDDIIVIRDISQRLHDAHVKAGEAEGQRIREAAQEEADALLERSHHQSQELLTSAQTEHDRLLQEAQSGYDRLVEAAKAQQARFVADGSQTRERLMMEGQKGRDDLLAKARTEHQELVEEARAEHDRLLEEGRSENERLISEGTAEHDRLLDEGESEHKRLIDEATKEHRRLLDEATREHRSLLDEGRSEHQRLIAEAEEQRAGILADLNARRELLEARVADLDRTQGEYRQRLRALVQQQLSALDDDGWQASAPSGPAEELQR